MPTTLSQIDLWRNAKTETQHLEFKEAKKGFSFDELKKYCVALANERGGILLLGIANKPPRLVVGTNAFLNPVKTADDLFHTLHFRVDIEEVKHPDGRVLVFNIPSRPIGHPYNLGGTYYMRSGESLVGMSTDQIQRILDERKYNRKTLISVLGIVFVLLLVLYFAFRNKTPNKSPVVALPLANVSVHMGCEPDHLPIHIHPATTVHIIRMLPSILRSSNSDMPGLGVFEDISSNSDNGIDWPPKSEAKLMTWNEMHKLEIETQNVATPYTSRCTLTSYSNATLERISADLIVDTSDKQRHSYPVIFEPLLTGSGFTFYLVNVCSSGAVPQLVQWQDRAVVSVLGEPNQRIVPLKFEKKAFPSSMSLPLGLSWYKWSGVPACTDW